MGNVEFRPDGMILHRARCICERPAGFPIRSFTRPVFEYAPAGETLRDFLKKDAHDQLIVSGKP